MHNEFNLHKTRKLQSIQSFGLYAIKVHVHVCTIYTFGHYAINVLFINMHMYIACDVWYIILIEIHVYWMFTIYITGFDSLKEHCLWYGH